MSIQQVSSVLLDIEKVVAYGFNHNLHSFNVKYNPVTVLLILKAHTSAGHPVVAFIETYSLEDCLWYLEKASRSNSAPLRWRVDKYGKRKEA